MIVEIEIDEDEILDAAVHGVLDNFSNQELLAECADKLVENIDADEIVTHLICNLHDDDQFMTDISNSIIDNENLSQQIVDRVLADKTVTNVVSSVTDELRSEFLGRLSQHRLDVMRQLRINEGRMIQYLITATIVISCITIGAVLWLG